MSKTTLFITLIMAVCAMISLNAANAEVTSNLIKNSTLAEGKLYWSLQDPYHRVVNDEGRNDSNSIYTKVTPGVTPYALCSQSVKVTGGKYYVFSVWVKTRGFRGKPVFCIEYASSNGYLGGTYTRQFPLKDGDNDWTQIICASGRTPKNTETVNLVISGAAGEMWWDDFELIESDEPAFLLSYPDPVSHGPTIISGVESPPVKIMLTRNRDVRLSVGKVKLRASIYEVDNQPPSSSTEAEESDNGVVELTVATDKMPLGTGIMRIEGMDSKTGAVVFRDDVEITKIERLTLDILSPSTMGVVGALPGQPLKLKCLLQDQLPGNAAGKWLDVELALFNLSGEMVDGPTVKTRVSAGKKTVVSFPMDNVPVGSYYLEAAACSPGSNEPIARTRRLVCRVDPASRPANAVDVLPNGFLRVDGKPFFPIGLYTISSLISLYPADRPRKIGSHQNPDYYDSLFKLVGSSPFNCILDYGGYYKKPLTNVDDMKRFLDKAHEYGVKVIYNVKDDILCAADRSEISLDNESLIGRVYPAVKTHPSVIALYLNDETNGPGAWEQKKVSQAFARRMDPWHPTYNLEFNYRHSSAYCKMADAYGTDPYYILGDISMCAKSWRTARSSMPDGQPMWAVVQAYGPGYETNNPANTTEPSYEEMRCGTFCAIAEGATGIIYYSLHSMQRSLEFPRRWKELCRVVNEVNDLVPIIALPKPAKSTKVVNGEASVLSRKDGSKFYTLVVNTDRKARSVTLKWPVDLRCVYDRATGAAIAVSGDTTKLEMPPLGVQVLIGEIK